MFVDVSTREVESDEAFLGVDFAVETEHLGEVVLVHDEVVVIERQWHREAGLDIDLVRVAAAEQGTNHAGLPRGTPQKVI